MEGPAGHRPVSGGSGGTCTLTKGLTWPLISRYPQEMKDNANLRFSFETGARQVLWLRLVSEMERVETSTKIFLFPTLLPLLAAHPGETETSRNAAAPATL